MKYEYKIPIHPMTEMPTGTFQYVYRDILGVGHWFAKDFNPNLNDATGWISCSVERTPILEEGKWYKAIKQDNSKTVVIYSDGHLHFDSDCSDYEPVQKFNIICEMTEVKDD